MEEETKRLKKFRVNKKQQKIVVGGGYNCVALIEVVDATGNYASCEKLEPNKHTHVRNKIIFNCAEKIFVPSRSE